MPPSPSPATMSPAPSSPAALAALLATALADVERLRLDLDATARRATAAENVLRALVPDNSNSTDRDHPDSQLSPTALATLVQAESRAGAAEARLQSMLDAWADLLRTEERAAEERKRIDDDARAARRALYPTAAVRRPGPRHPFPGGTPSLQFPNGNGAIPNNNTHTNNNITTTNNPRIRPRTASDAAHAPAKRVRNNNWAHDRPPSRSPDALAGPGQGVPPPEPHAPMHPHAAHHPHVEPSVEDLILETVERPPRRGLQPEPTLLSVPDSPSKQPQSQGSVVKTASGGGTGGPRTCRQCGQAGRYKDGKCVEKWGPGPEGPGTVCDRCRKKMKRVERRGDTASISTASLLPTTPAPAPAPPSSPAHASTLAPPAHSPPPTFSPLPPAPVSPPSNAPSSHSHSPASDDIASSKDDGEDVEMQVNVKRETSAGVA